MKNEREDGQNPDLHTREEYKVAEDGRDDRGGHETAKAAQHRAPGVTHEVSGDDPVGIARDAEIGDLAETQDAAISPQQAEPERHRNVQKIVGDVVGGEIREIERNREKKQR